jgi:hypothetical protein
MQTKKNYPCSNYEIQATVRRSFSEARFRLYDVGLGPICLTSLGPATRADFLDWAPGHCSLVIQNSDGSMSTTPSLTRSGRAASQSRARATTRYGGAALFVAIQHGSPAPIALRRARGRPGRDPARVLVPEAGLAPYGRTTVFMAPRSRCALPVRGPTPSSRRGPMAWQAAISVDVPPISISLTNWNNKRATRYRAGRRGPG